MRSRARAHTQPRSHSKHTRSSPHRMAKVMRTRASAPTSAGHAHAWPPPHGESALTHSFSLSLCVSLARARTLARLLSLSPSPPLSRSLSRALSLKHLEASVQIHLRHPTSSSFDELLELGVPVEFSPAAGHDLDHRPPCQNESCQRRQLCCHSMQLHGFQRLERERKEGERES